MPDPITWATIAVKGWDLLRKVWGGVCWVFAKITGRAKLNALQAEFAALRQEIEKLREAAPAEHVNRADYKLERNAYWKDGVPYCIRCMEEDHKARTLMQPGHYNTTGVCPTCQRTYGCVFEAKPVSFSAMQKRARLEGLENP